MNEKLHSVVEKIYQGMHSKVFVPPVQSLLDVDFYKFTMGQFIHRFYPDVEVEFKLIIRDKNMHLWKYVDPKELQEAIDYVAALSMRKTDLYYLRGMDLYDKYMFSESYLDFLKKLQLPRIEIKSGDGNAELSFKARWCEVTYWETIVMSIISELYYRGVMKSLSEDEVYRLYAVADGRLRENLRAIKDCPKIRFSDFGHRRRNSFLWHKYVVGECKRVLGEQFTGTSDTWLAFHYDLAPIGTNAHELPMVTTALADLDDDIMRISQYLILKKWQEVYGQGLRIVLPDTYGSEQFFKNAPHWLAAWKGQRQDSGDPIIEGERYMTWLRSKGVDPKTKVTIFSDGLDVPAMQNISEHFHGQHIAPFGWGTLLTNNFRGVIPGNTDLRPFSFVCKVVSANGRPCVKLSNDLNKATGPREAIAKYVEVFGAQHRVSREVCV